MSLPHAHDQETDVELQLIVRSKLHLLCTSSHLYHVITSAALLGVPPRSFVKEKQRIKYIAESVVDVGEGPGECCPPPI